MEEGWLVCFNISHIAEGADLGSCLNLMGAAVTAKPMALYIKREIVAEEWETGRPWGKNLLSIGKLDFAWYEIIL